MKSANKFAVIIVNKLHNLWLFQHNNQINGTHVVILQVGLSKYYVISKPDDCKHTTG